MTANITQAGAVRPYLLDKPFKIAAQRRCLLVSLYEHMILYLHICMLYRYLHNEEGSTS